MFVNAKYIGTQFDPTNDKHFALVNIRREFGINTERYDPFKHALSTDDLHKLYEDARKIREKG